MYYLVLKSTFTNTNFETASNSFFRTNGNSYSATEFSNLCNKRGFDKNNYFVRFIQDEEE